MGGMGLRPGHVLAIVMLVVTTAAEARAQTLRVDAGGDGCPRRKELVASLELRMPGLTRPAAAGVPVRRLEVAQAAGIVSLRLWDERGALVLERRLGGDDAGRAGAADRCQALADAAALVVERYLREIGYRPPAASVPEPPAPPARPAPEPAAPAPASAPAPTAAPAPAPAAQTTARATGTAAGAVAGVGPPELGLLGAGGGLRPASGGTRGEAVLVLEVQRGWLAAGLSGGVSTALVRTVAGSAAGRLQLRSFPLRLQLGVPVPVPGGALVPALGFSGELVSFRASDVDDPQAGVRFDPAAELTLGYLIVVRGFYLRASAAGGLTLAPRDYEVNPPGLAVYRSPAAYLRTQVELGLVLWKN